MTGTSGAAEGARRATAADLASIRALLAAAAAEKRGQRGGLLFLAREAAGAAGQLDDLHEASRLFVGTYDDVVVGVAAFVPETLEDGSVLARLLIFVVDPEARAAGVGEAMMNLVVEHATAIGCTHLDAFALPGDRETKNFFESFGLKARLLIVGRPLGAP